MDSGNVVNETLSDVSRVGACTMHSNCIGYLGSCRGQLMLPAAMTSPAGALQNATSKARIGLLSGDVTPEEYSAVVATSFQTKGGLLRGAVTSLNPQGSLRMVITPIGALKGEAINVIHLLEYVAK